ncbi:NAD(P)/FAD-dependent oxidoreductase [Sphingobium bisphenolivorans]|uniref:NAD(P)/FAD-dependent oxidoreductase n=1 Tax=Sphingobium bisphenolivorans TaxID=1335760 RepID=UPI0003B60F06|nr:FAD-dependent monooxygenase [Sphingobium bisphenolivorans]
MASERAPLIVGGGPAGAAAAIALAQAGISATLLERRAEPGDALCGGFLSWETLAKIERLGIDAQALGGHDIERLALFAGDREIVVPLPRPGMGLSRRRLDTLLLLAAGAAGADIRLGVTVQEAEAGRVHLASGEQLAWESLFHATGKHDLRGLLRPHDAADPHLGLRLRLPAGSALARLLDGRIELHLFRRGYLGLILQEDGSANACLAVRKSRLNAAGGQPRALFGELADGSPALADRLAGMDGAAIDAVGNVPYGWRARSTPPGLYRLGDQAAVIHSLAGEGIGIALSSGVEAAACWLNHGAAGAPLYQRRFSRRVARPVRLSGLIEALGGRPTLLAALAGTRGVLPLAARLTRLR